MENRARHMADQKYKIFSLLKNTIFTNFRKILGVIFRGFLALIGIAQK
jgi:hypothetical protein